MSEEMLFKPQQEWLDHFGELAKEHGEMLPHPFVEFFADKILLTKKEVEKAREMLGPGAGCEYFLGYKKPCEERPIGIEGLPPFENDPYCRLCKKLTEFAKGGEDEY